MQNLLTNLIQFFSVMPLGGSKSASLCDDDMRALIVAKNYLETEVSALKAVSHAYACTCVRVEDFTTQQMR